MLQLKSCLLISPVMSTLTEQSVRDDTWCFWLPVYFDLKARCPLWMIWGMTTFLLAIDKFFTCNPSGKCSVVPPDPSSLLWNDLGAKQVASPRENNIPIDPLGASDVWRLPHHFLLHVVQHPESKRICTVLGGLNNDETPNASMKKSTVPRKMKTETRCVKKSWCSHCQHEIYYLWLQHATVNAANQFCSSFEAYLLWALYLVREISCYQNHVPLDFGLLYPFVRWRPEGFYRLANGIDEQRTVGKWKPQEADPRIGQNLDNQWCVCFLWTASLLVRHLREGEKSLIIKVDCNASML